MENYILHHWLDYSNKFIKLPGKLFPVIVVVNINPNFLRIYGLI